MSQKKLRIIHIEDEPEALKLLESIISKYVPEAAYIASANSVLEGEKLVRNNEFDLLFLDLQLTDGSGLSLCRKYPDITAKTVLCTADDSKGVEALNSGIFYYIVKPINIREVTDVIQKYHTQHFRADPKEEKINLLENKLIIPDNNGIEIIPVDSIIRLEAEQNYTHIHLNTGISLFVSKTLKIFEETLSEFSFIRIHRSHLINIDYIRRINRNNGGSVELTTGESFKLSQGGKQELKDKFNL